MLSSDFTPAEFTDEPLPPLLGALLRIPWEYIRARMLEGLRQRGYTDLIPTHLNVLQYPGPDGARPSELAAQTRMTRQAIHYLLQQLERLGYLERQDDPLKPHAKRIKLTARGRDVEQAIREIVSEVEHEWEQALGPEPVQQLRDILRQLRTVLQT